MVGLLFFENSSHQRANVGAFCFEGNFLMGCFKEKPKESCNEGPETNPCWELPLTWRQIHVPCASLEQAPHDVARLENRVPGLKFLQGAIAAA